MLQIFIQRHVACFITSKINLWSRGVAQKQKDFVVVNVTSDTVVIQLVIGLISLNVKQSQNLLNLRTQTRKFQSFISQFKKIYNLTSVMLFVERNSYIFVIISLAGIIIIAFMLVPLIIFINKRSKQKNDRSIIHFQNLSLFNFIFLLIFALKQKVQVLYRIDFHSIIS